MDDLTICKKIAEVEGLINDCSDIYIDVDGKVRLQEDYSKPPSDHKKSYEYNPLTDDRLCFQLMVKYKVEIDFCHGVAGIGLSYLDGEESCVSEKNINKAICLAIIEAHKESVNE